MVVQKLGKIVCQLLVFQGLTVRGIYEPMGSFRKLRKLAWEDNKNLVAGTYGVFGFESLWFLRCSNLRNSFLIKHLVVFMDLGTFNKSSTITQTG